MIENISSQLKNSTVIVVTNPTTPIVKYLVEQGIQAFGIGVANDQFRFVNQNETKYQKHYFIGAHNFYDLTLGTYLVENRSNFLFTHEEYKKILFKQDRSKHITLTGLSKLQFLDYNWNNLETVNHSFPAEFRWYARQRIHSKYHSTTISCALVVLNTINFFLDNQSRSEVVSLEMPLFIPEMNKDVVIGWPIDNDSKEPIELSFDSVNEKRVVDLFSKYEIGKSHNNSPLFFKSPFGEYLSIKGKREVIFEFYKKCLANLFSIHRIRKSNREVGVNIDIHQQIDIFESIKKKVLSGQYTILPQHRGKNECEHTDLRIYSEGSLRYVLFPNDLVCAKVDDSSKTIEIYYKEKEALFTELRRIIRDEIAIPLFIANNVRILHAGLLIYKDVVIMVVGTQGRGKSTAVLSTICSDVHSKYGSSERVAIWIENGKFYCLGIPESNTVYAGILSQIPQFVKYSTVPEIDLWNRNKKIRLQIDDILQCTGCSVIRREVQVDLIIEVNYDSSSSVSSSKKIGDDKLCELLQFNDLTEIDDIRYPWLNWFSFVPPNRFYDNIIDKLPVYRIDWSNVEGLREEIANIVARYKVK